MNRLHFNVAGDRQPEGDVPYLLCDLNGEIIPGEFPAPNRLTVHVPVQITGGATLYYQDGKRSFRVIVPPIVGDNGDWEAGQPPCLPPELKPEDVALIYQSFYAPLPILTPHGHVFRAGGQHWYGNMASGFAAFEKYLRYGYDAVAPILEQRRQLGFNMLRVWTAYHVPLIGSLCPREWSRFYQRIPEFNRVLASFGLYGYWTGLTGEYYDCLFPGTEQKIIDHDEEVMEALLQCDSPVLYDRQNEADHPANKRVPRSRLAPVPEGLLWSAGSGQKDVRPPEPFGTFYGFHPASFEWQRKVGKQGWEVDPSRPCASDETVRVEHGNIPLQQIRDASATGLMFNAISCFHSPAGKEFRLYEGYELEAARAWCEGARLFPLDVVQDGQYVNQGGIAQAEGLLRCYDKVLGDRVARHKIHY